MRNLTALIGDLKSANGELPNRKNRRTRAALSRRIVRRLKKQTAAKKLALAKRAKDGQQQILS